MPLRVSKRPESLAPKQRPVRSPQWLALATSSPGVHFALWQPGRETWARGNPEVNFHPGAVAARAMSVRHGCFERPSQEESNCTLHKQQLK
jgi:hypothetical protein